MRGIRSRGAEGEGRRGGRRVKRDGIRDKACSGLFLLNFFILADKGGSVGVSGSEVRG